MNSVYLYPKSSCWLSECKKEYPIPKNPIQTNLAVENCNVSPYFSCYYKAELGRQVQPTDEQGWVQLNNQVYTSKLSPDFQKIPCKQDGCPDLTYVSSDPRLFSSTRAQYLPLDRPPMNGDVRLKDVYNPKWDSYTDGFHQYKNIQEGQIAYYIDKSIQHAFYKPVFSEPAVESSNLYVDPMGAVKPEYNRIQVVNTKNPATTTPDAYPYCLSTIQDSQSFREDIMALQQRKNNQSKWSARWPVE